MANQFTINIPSGLTEFQKQRIADKTGAYIRETTKKGLSPIDGSRYEPYSKSYKELKSDAGLQSTPPDLRWTSDTLESVDLLSTTSSTITMGPTPDTDEADKAKWLEASDNGPSRKFLGINQTKLDSIISEVQGERVTEEAESILSSLGLFRTDDT